MFAMWQAVQRIDALYKTVIFGINLGEKPLNHILDFDIGYIILLLVVAGTQFLAMRLHKLWLNVHQNIVQANKCNQ